MTYRLVYTHRAVRDIKKLPEDIRKRIGKTLLRYQVDPLNFAENLTEPALGTYRFRVGDYRIIFDLEGEDIIILRVGHRRELYAQTCPTTITTFRDH